MEEYEIVYESGNQISVPPAVEGGGDPVSFDTSALGTQVTEVTTAQVSITVASGSNLALFVCAHWLDSIAGSAVVSGVSSSVDGAFAQVAGAQIIKANAGEGVDLGLDWWVLVDPTPGAHTITVTWNEAVDEGWAGACSFQNVDQTTPYENVDTDESGTAGTFNDVITTADGGAVVSAMVYYAGANDKNITAGTSMWDDFAALFWGQGVVAGYELSDAASETISFGSTGTTDSAVSGLSIKQA